MSTRKLVVLSVSAPLLLAACSEDNAPEPTTDVCPISGPTLVLSPPDGWQPDKYESNASVQAIGDRLMYSFGDLPVGGDVYLRDLCGGEPELVLDHTRGIRSDLVLDGPAGRVLYGDADGVLYIVDRLDEPGADAPKPIAGLPSLLSGGGTAVERHAHGPVFRFPGSAGDPDIYGIAGLGAATSELWTHNGIPDAPAVLLGTDVIHHAPVGEQLWLHTDDGRVRLYDQPTGDETLVAEGARYATALMFGDRMHALVQDIGDDQAETVRLVDIETGDSRPVTINDFTQSSFGRDAEHGGAGRWTTLQKGADSFIGLRGPDGALIEGYTVATLAPVDLPDHIGVTGPLGAPWVNLILDDPNDFVVAAWDPFTGSVQEWYRGSNQEFAARNFYWFEGQVQYREELSDRLYRISALDITTGTTTIVIPEVGDSHHRLPDGRVLTDLPVGEFNAEVVLFDPMTQAYTTVVDETRRWQYVADPGLIIYTDYMGPEPGVWATPLPPR